MAHGLLAFSWMWHVLGGATPFRWTLVRSGIALGGKRVQAEGVFADGLALAEELLVLGRQ